MNESPIQTPASSAKPVARGGAPASVRPVRSVGSVDSFGTVEPVGAAGSVELRTGSVEEVGPVEVAGPVEEAGAVGCGPVCATRRTALVLGAVSGAALLTGCATYGGSGAQPAAPAEASDPAGGAEKDGDATEAAKGDGDGAGDGKPALTSTSAIPVGGGKVFAAKKVVVTQPSAGTFKAFSSVCPHAGCDVNEVKGGTINCPCHGSKFAIADGSVTAGPSPRGLPSVRIAVTGDAVVLE